MDLEDGRMILFRVVEVVTLPRDGDMQLVGMQRNSTTGGGLLNDRFHRHSIR